METQFDVYLIREYENGSDPLLRHTFGCAFNSICHKGDGDEQCYHFLCGPARTQNDSMN